MPRDKETYAADHRQDYVTEHTSELPDWRKQRAAETFLSQLEIQDHHLAQDIKAAATDPEHKASWLTTAPHRAEHQYDCLRKAAASLDHKEREYVAHETTQVLLGPLRAKSQNYATQPASHVVQGDAPPDLRVSFDPDGYNQIMSPVQAELNDRLNEAGNAMEQSIINEERYDFINAVTDLRNLNQTIRAMETGDPLPVLKFASAKNRDTYYKGCEQRENDLLHEYTSSINLEFPELGQNARNPSNLLTDPGLTEKFRWFVESYELLPRDSHALAHRIYTGALEQRLTDNPGTRLEAVRTLLPLRNQLLNPQE